AIQLDASFLRLDESNDHVERRRLARSIGAEQPDDLALLQPERHIVHHPAAAVGLDEAERFENAAGSWRRDRALNAAVPERHMFTRVTQDVADTGALDGRTVRDEREPVALGHMDGRIVGAQTAGWQNDEPLLDETWQHRLGQVCADLVEAQPAGLLVRIPACLAQHAQMILAIQNGDIVEDDIAAVARRADECVQRQRRRAVAARGLLDELFDFRRELNVAHGLTLDGGRGAPCPGVKAGAACDVVSRRVVSAGVLGSGSRYTPAALPTISTFCTSRRAKFTVICSPRT